LVRGLAAGLQRGAAVQRAVWPHLVVVLPPSLDDSPGILEIREPVHVEALVPEPPVEALNECVLDWFARPDEVDRHRRLVGPLVEGLAGELGAVVTDDEFGLPAGLDEPLKLSADPPA